MVYRGGLENRCAGNGTGGSNPSPSAKDNVCCMKTLLYVLLVAVFSGIFLFLLRRGYFLRISAFFRETEEELKKCTWPTWDELKGSTVVVTISIAILGLLTVLVDFGVTAILRLLITHNA